MTALTEEKALEAMKLIALFQDGKLKRRHIRYKLFRIRENNPEFLTDGLKEIIEAQLDSNKGLTWESFTFQWDVAANDPFKVILKRQWNETGGGYDENGKHYPPAFTKQGI